MKFSGYTFKDIKLFETAVCHSSYVNETKEGDSYERLEFLGDSVLSVLTSEFLYENVALPEGELTKIRATIVCESSLAKFARQLDLGSMLKLGRGEENNGGRKRPSILADVFEAVLAAIYLDGGLDSARTFLIPFVEQAMTGDKQEVTDYKTELQEIIQKNPEEKITYVLISQQGPDHEKEFFVEVRLNSNVIGKGKGKSKKLAEQMAAKEALSLMGR